MFDPLGWLALPEQLALTADEATLRTAIGRAYYAVFVRSRDALTAAGLMIAQRARRDHRSVVEALRRNRRGQAAIALESLARMRKRADYDCELAVSAAEAQRAVALAREVRRLSATEWGLAR